MLTTSAKFTISDNEVTRDIIVTPLFLQNHKEPWQPNEIYELQQVIDADTQPKDIGKIIVDEHMDWHYEGEHEISDDEVQQIAQFVLSQI